jgi:hypothetical protein
MIFTQLRLVWLFPPSPARTKGGSSCGLGSLPGLGSSPLISVGLSVVVGLGLNATAVLSCYACWRLRLPRPPKRSLRAPVLPILSSTVR